MWTSKNRSVWTFDHSDHDNSCLLDNVADSNFFEYLGNSYDSSKKQMFGDILGIVS